MSGRYDAAAGRKQYVVGLTGGIGSGKSTVATAFERLGVTVIDADAIAHEITAPGGPGVAPIRAAFGADFLTMTGALDRERMRAHVFEQADRRARLEAILHPLIRAESARRLAQAASEYAMLMIPLLVEAARGDPGHWRDRYDRILVVDCAEATQIARVKRRSGLDESQIGRIMAAQASRASRLALADDVIDNDGDVEGIAQQVAVLHERYLLQARSERL